MTDPRGSRPILLVGPTASGKSDLALALADAVDGVVINADALQVYDGWRILTARPSDADLARAPHLLFGHAPIARLDYSVGAWLREVEAALARVAEARRRAIIVGGTGLYFTALTRGLAEIPDVAPEIRAAAEARLAEVGREAFAAELARRDPETGARVDPLNPRRLVRAWEVLEGTGRGLAAWAAETPAPLVAPEAATRIALAPDRDALAARIERRLERMVAAGALEEARARAADVAAGRLSWSAPGMKAIGARPFAAHVEGAIDLAEALARAGAETRQYAKRQRTWLRNQLGDWQRIATVGDEIAADAAAIAKLSQ